eukprot:29420-Pelagococcus_subviridis.AAC.3
MTLASRRASGIVLNNYEGTIHPGRRRSSSYLPHAYPSHPSTAVPRAQRPELALEQPLHERDVPRRRADERRRLQQRVPGHLRRDRVRVRSVVPVPLLLVLHLRPDLVRDVLQRYDRRLEVGHRLARRRVVREVMTDEDVVDDRARRVVAVVDAKLVRARALALELELVVVHAVLLERDVVFVVSDDEVERAVVGPRVEIGRRRGEESAERVRDARRVDGDALTPVGRDRDLDRARGGGEEEREEEDDEEEKSRLGIIARDPSGQISHAARVRGTTRRTKRTARSADTLQTPPRHPELDSARSAGPAARTTSASARIRRARSDLPAVDFGANRRGVLSAARSDRAISRRARGVSLRSTA